MCYIGYCRISTKTQSIERQIRNIQAEYPNANIITEAYTGTKMDRPKWNKIYKEAKDGDTIIFDSVSRMSRDAEEGINTYFDLYDRGVNLIFLKESYINTDTYRQAIKQTIPNTNNEIADIFIEATNKVIKLLAKDQIKKAFEQAEKEVKDLQERTKEGIETVKKRNERIELGLEKGRPTQIGQKKGRKLKVKKKDPIKAEIKRLSKDFDGKLSDAEVMELVKLSRNTYYKYKKEVKADIESIKIFGF